MLPRIGIIAGKGLLPFSIADGYIKRGGDCYIALLQDEADLKLNENFKCKVFKIGMVGAVIEYFKENDVQHLVFAGGINRPNIRSIGVDKVGGVLLGKILKQKFLGDDTILRVIANFFEEQGFKVIASSEILKNNYFKNEVITALHPSAADMIDIELGIKVLKSLSDVDVGQSVITQNKYVLGIEAAEGTDNLIIRCSSLRQTASGGVLIKIMKLNQDSRMDIPTIGPDTILNLAKYNYNGIAIGDTVIIIDQELTVELANKYKIFIVKAKC
ncbi:LpxI family protein [Rickettsia endosymbiont of Halotydeus destructor]|uniref:LpxI family protein n=1 Tax=Rickettsia endosymbiont of Halotydeus destructor TaxID=2996754 RepID=UPI003BAF42E4